METFMRFNRSIPSDLNGICEVVCDVIRYVQQSYGTLDDCTIFELQVMLNELLINAIKHGNKEDREKQVRIYAGITQRKSLILCIEDEGEGYDYRKLLVSNTNWGPCQDVFNMKETGRGLLIVNNLCDKLKFNKEGNKAIILKRLNGRSN